MSEIKPLPAPSILANTIGTDNEKITDIIFQAVPKIMEKVKEIMESDSVCTCEARVICSNATEDSVPHHVKNGEGLIHTGNIEELNRTNIEPCENFEGCTKSPDGKCMIAQKYKEWIADQEWKAVDETGSQGEGKEKLNKETSYMVCTEYEGVIYFKDDGQVIRDFLNEENDGDFTESFKEKHPEKFAYLKQYIGAAKVEQLRAGVPWQITLGQLVQEAGWDVVVPTDIYTGVYSYNLFGIKNFKPESEEDFVRDWTPEEITESELDKWEKEHKKWAREDEELQIVEKNGDKIKIEVIQPFRRFDSYEDGIAFHSEVLMNDLYSEAWEYKNNPFIFLAIIAPTYASDSDYENGVSNIMKGDFEWKGKEKDWEDYEAWKENH